MQPIPSHIRLGFSLFCILTGGLLLSVTNYFFSKFTPIVGILVGGMIVGFVYYLPGAISILRDILLLITLILTCIIALILQKVYCSWSFSQTGCTLSAFRAATFDNIIFPGGIIVYLWLDLRISQLLLLIKMRKRKQD